MALGATPKAGVKRIRCMGSRRLTLSYCTITLTCATKELRVRYRNRVIGLEDWKVSPVESMGGPGSFYLELRGMAIFIIAMPTEVSPCISVLYSSGLTVPPRLISIS